MRMDGRSATLLLTGIGILVSSIASAQITIDGMTITFSDASTQDTTAVEGGSELVRTIVVSPTPGDTAASGTALRNAYEGISDASPTNPYVVLLEPGIYNIGSTQLDLKPYVHLRGTSRESTIILSSHTASIDFGCLDANSVAFVELSNFTLLLSGTNNVAGIWAFSSTVYMENVNVKFFSAVNGSAYGVAMSGSGADLRMTDCRIDIANYAASSTLIGVRIEGGDGATLEGCTVNINGEQTSSSAGRVLGVDAREGGSAKLRNSRVTALDSTATNSHGLLAFTGTMSAAACELDGSTAEAGATNMSLVNCWDSNLIPIADM